ncbi:MAG: winged helix-turn-helix domain-containing protein [Firmicutes bacterium]|nr:winged helix-turn-helix domain-containing protein [Bacillota bacterium]
MKKEEFKVQMLGSFSVQLGEKKIDDSTSRTRKVWLLLAYLLYHKGRTISQKELIDLLWEDDEEKDNPQNALRTTFHRVRTLLNKLDENAGHNLILHQGGGYIVSPEIEVSIDVREFDKFCKEGDAADTDEKKLECWLEAISLYNDDFLVKLSAESWSRSVALHYHEIYINIVKDTLAMLEERQRRQEAVDICNKALKIEPYSEEVYLHLMTNLLAMGERREVISTYEKISKIFLADFGVLPSEEIRNIYYEAIKTSNEKAVPMEVVQEQLKETEALSGALVCEYDFFKVLHYSTARLIERTGAAVHICMINVAGEHGKALSKRSHNTVMENLQEQIRINLRRGDVVSQCSSSQFIIMLHLANYENSCMVCDRIIKSFKRQYPHSPAELTYTVKPLEPGA